MSLCGTCQSAELPGRLVLLPVLLVGHQRQHSSQMPRANRVFINSINHHSQE